MGPYPRARLEAYHPPFIFTGVDLFGPLTIKWGRGTTKRWGCLFTPLTTRAVYLEVILRLRQMILSSSFDTLSLEEDRLKKFGLIEGLTLLEPTES